MLPVVPSDPTSPRLPAIVLTGGSGFLGRHLLAALVDRYRFFVIARRTQAEAKAPVHPNITWLQVDIAESGDLAQCFDRIVAEGGADVVLHFAAYYDFASVENPEYERTNVTGLANVLEQCRRLSPKRFVFASSLAACALPKEGAFLDEHSEPNGAHIYARTKAQGESMVRAAQAHFPTCIVRLGCLFSDFCEYPPLFVFLATWLSKSWRARILGGRGRTAIPYIHIRDGVAFFRRVLELSEQLGPCPTLIASPNQATSHLELYRAATQHWYGQVKPALLVPRALAWLGMYVMDFIGRYTGERPFEQPWMGAYIDTVMATKADRTYAVLGWRPNPRLAVLRRMPFLLENLKEDPLEWNQKNMAAMKAVHVATHLRIFHVLEAREEELVRVCSEALTQALSGGRLSSYRCLGPSEAHDCCQATITALKNSIKSRDHGAFREYCRTVAERRFRQSFACRDVLDMLRMERDHALQLLATDPLAAPVAGKLRRTVQSSFALGIDEVIDVFEALSGTVMDPTALGGEDLVDAAP